MNPEQIVGQHGLVAGTFVFAFVSGVLPALNTEVYLVAVAALGREALLPAVLAAASAGQMLAKSLFYLAGRGLVKLPMGRTEARVEEWRAKLAESPRSVDLLLFSAASWGVPPFLVAPYLAGYFRLSFWRFLIWGLLGRYLRFAAVALLPAVIRHLWG